MSVHGVGDSAVTGAAGVHGEPVRRADAPSAAGEGAAAGGAPSWREVLDFEAVLQAAERAQAAAGEVGKLLGMARADEAADPEWRARVDQAIGALATARDEHGEPLRFTAEDVRAIAGDPPGHPNAMGARFNAAARRGQIRKVAYRLATRPSLHCHPISVWVGTERPKGAVPDA